MNYFFSQDGIFVIPIEHLSREGISTPFREELLARGALDDSALELFGQAWSRYWKRLDMLSQKLPRTWFPPRLQHLCVVTAPRRIRPWFQPFHRNSWLLYAADFQPENSSAEFLCYQFVHIERMNLLGQVVPALFANRDWFERLGPGPLAGFVEGCERTGRPDAEAWRALGRLLQSGKVSQRQFNRLEAPWVATAEQVVQAYRGAHQPADSSDISAFCSWLDDNQPDALITAAKGAVVWPAELAASPDDLPRALRGCSVTGLASMRADIEVIDRCSRRFRKALTAPADLSRPASYMTEGGLSYIHRDHMRVAYDIGPGRNGHRLWEATPPFERLMLAARTTHEWCHLAAESGWIPIPDVLRQQRGELEQQLASFFPGTDSRGELAAMLRRIEDYQSNLLARRFLSAEELGTYVRNNVHSHQQDYSAAQAPMHLIRLAYEFQYLRLTGMPDPARWLLESTWFSSQFEKTGIISRQRFIELTELIAAICDCYRIDESKFDFSEE